MNEVSMEGCVPQIMSPIHPGEILEEEFLAPMKYTPHLLAKAVGMDEEWIQAIIRGERAICAETALRFSRFFGNSPELWMRIQDHYELEVAKDRLGDKLDSITAYQWE